MAELAEWTFKCKLHILKKIQMPFKRLMISAIKVHYVRWKNILEMLKFVEKQCLYSRPTLILVTYQKKIILTIHIAHTNLPILLPFLWQRFGIFLCPKQSWQRHRLSLKEKKIYQIVFSYGWWTIIEKKICCHLTHSSKIKGLYQSFYIRLKSRNFGFI